MGGELDKTSLFGRRVFANVIKDEFTLHQDGPWRRKWQLTPVFLPRESRGQRSLVGCCPQGRTGQDTTEATQQLQQQDRPSWVAQVVKNLPAMQETLVGKFPWRRDRLPTPVFLGFPGGFDGKESAHNVGDLGLIPGLGRSPGESQWTEWATVHGVAKSRT